MRAYCAPWPGNIKTGCGTEAATVPLARIGESAVRSAATAWATSLATKQARCAKALRPTRRVWATSGRDASGCASR